MEIQLNNNLKNKTKGRETNTYVRKSPLENEAATWAGNTSHFLLAQVSSSTWNFYNHLESILYVFLS